MNTMLIASFITLAVLLLYYIIQPSGVIVESESKSILKQQNHSFIAKLAGNKAIPPVNTIATGIAKFDIITPDNSGTGNEVYYEINITNIHNDITRIDVHTVKKLKMGV
jgi:hypothetical protein